MNSSVGGEQGTLESNVTILIRKSHLQNAARVDLFHLTDLLHDAVLAESQRQALSGAVRGLCEA